MTATKIKEIRMSVYDDVTEAFRRCYERSHVDRETRTRDTAGDSWLGQPAICRSVAASSNSRACIWLNLDYAGRGHGACIDKTSAGRSAGIAGEQSRRSRRA